MIRKKSCSRASWLCSVVRQTLPWPCDALVSLGQPSSSWGCVPQRWVAHVVMGCRTGAFASLRHRGVASLSVGLPASLWAALLQCSCLFIVVGSCTSALGCPRRRGLPYLGVRISSLSWHCVVAFGCPHRCGLPDLSVRLPSSSWGCMPRRWAALLGRLPPFVVVWCRASAFGCLHRRVAYLGIALPCRGVSLSSSSCGSNVGVGPPDVGARPSSSWGVGPRRCRGVGGERGVRGVSYRSSKERTAKMGHDFRRGPFS